MVQNITYETGFNMPTLMGNPKPPAILIPYRYLIQKEFQDCLTQLEDFSDDIVSHFARLEGPSQGIDLEQFGKAKPIFIHSLRDVFKITKPQDYRVVTALAMIKSGENKNADRKKRPCRKNRKRPRSSKQDSSQRNPFSSVSSSAPKTTKNNKKALFPSTTSTRHKSSITTTVGFAITNATVISILHVNNTQFVRTSTSDTNASVRTINNNTLEEQDVSRFNSYQDGHFR
eukprot:PhF_6_TR26236/c0_g2_i2/m.37470